MCLAKGSTLMFIPKPLRGLSREARGFPGREQVSFIYWVSTIMVNIANQDLMAGRTLEAIKKVLFGAEVLPAKHLNYWRRHVPNATFINNYGRRRSRCNAPVTLLTGSSRMQTGSLWDSRAGTQICSF